MSTHPCAYRINAFVCFFHFIYHTADITGTIKPKQNTPAKLLELVSKEHVSEEDLSDNVCKVEELAGKEFEEVSSSLCLLLVEIPEVCEMSASNFCCF